MYRVLIADDEVIERKVLYKTLSKHLGDQCEIYQAENGREALQIYREKKIQIMILDIEMPGINGIETAEKIREMDKDCCIIFLTAFDEFAYAKKAILVRALDYLLKPYEEKEFLLIMDEAMRLTEERMKLHTQSVVSCPAVEVPVKEEPRREEIHSMDDMNEAENSSLRQLKVKKKIADYIHEHYMYELSMQDLARIMNYSEAYFCKLFKQCFDQNFTSYLTEYRMEQARKLLLEPSVNIKEVGKAVGYSDANYFAKVFKRTTGHSPTEYRLGNFKK